MDNKWGKKALDRIYSDILGSTDQMPGVQVQHGLVSKSLKPLLVLFDLKQAVTDRDA